VQKRTRNDTWYQSGSRSDVGSVLRTAGQVVIEYAARGTPIFAAISVLKRVVRIAFPWLRADFYLDWSLPRWREFYAREDPVSLVEIELRDQTRPIPEVLVLDNTDGKYSLRQVVFEPTGKRYALSATACNATAKAFVRYGQYVHFWHLTHEDRANARLCEVKVTSRRIRMKVEEVNYFDYVRTNLCLDARVGQSRSLRQMVHEAARQLQPIGESLLGDQIGVDVLLFTTDGRLIVQRRSRSVATHPGQYCPSVSGTIRSADVTCAGKTICLADVPIMREGIEEVGVSAEDLKIDSMKFLGLTRDLIRGGQPDLFFWAIVNLTSTEILARWKRSPSRSESKHLYFIDMSSAACDEVESPRQEHWLRSSVEELYSQLGWSNISLPFGVNLALWLKAKCYPLSVKKDAGTAGFGKSNSDSSALSSPPAGSRSASSAMPASASTGASTLPRARVPSTTTCPSPSACAAPSSNPAR
jgi:hypothetical protein